MKKNLALVFSTFSLNNDKKRLDEYAACYKQFLRIIPNDFDVVFIDNSVSSITDINNENLKNILQGQKIIFSNSNKGLKNKGVGELSMLIDADKNIDFMQYNTICYCTGRKFFTCPYAFDKATSTDKLATVSNPDYLYLDGTLIKSAPYMYNDMFFAMKSHIMKKFILETEPKLETMEISMINSETNLFDFINKHQIEVNFLNSIGLVRSDNYAVSSDKFTYHIC